MDNTKLSQLICTRISHDIIGNVGALSNALELMEDGDEDFFSDIKEILCVSSKVLSARMKIFRLAFGLENSALNDDKTVLQTIENYLNTLGNMNYPYKFAAENTLPEHNRLVLLGTMLMADLLIKGGDIKSCYENGGLWIASTTNTPCSEEKLGAIKKILSGSDEYDNDAQYAHVFCMRELVGKQRKINLIGNSENPILVIK